MKKRTPFILGALLLSLFAGCSKPAEPKNWTSSEAVIIEPGVSFGPVRSGMTMQQVVAALGQPDQKQDGVLKYRNLGLAVLPGRGGVAQSVIFVGGLGQFAKSSFVHTKEGIGIGSSRADVVSVYGKPAATKPGPEVEILGYNSFGFHIKNDQVCSIAVFFKP